MSRKAKKKKEERKRLRVFIFLFLFSLTLVAFYIVSPSLSSPCEKNSKYLRNIMSDQSTTTILENQEIINLQNRVLHLQTQLESVPDPVPSVSASNFPFGTLSQHFMVFIDTEKITSNHAIDPDILLNPWDENDTTSKLAELPYRYMRKGGWRECRQACDQRQKCTAFKYEVGHQTCFLIKIQTEKNNESRMIQKWDETVFKQWAKYSTPQLLSSSRKGRFDYHQHIWGFVTLPKRKTTSSPSSMNTNLHTTFSIAEKNTLFNACLQLGGCQKKNLATKPTLEKDEYIFDSFKPIGDMIEAVFTTNPFGSEPAMSIRKNFEKNGDMDWRMCREVCRSMNTIVTCVGYVSFKMECKFYK